MLEGIITSKATRKILGIMFANPENKFYIRQLEKLTSLPVNAVNREIKKLTKTGFLIMEKQGNRKFYRINKQNPIYPELKTIIFKTQILGPHLREQLQNVQEIKVAFIYGSVAKDEEAYDSDIDLFVIGSIDDLALHEKISEIEDEINRRINYTLTTPQELKKHKTDFIKRIFKEDKLFLVGNEHELGKIT